jgi:biotin transport system substrate-specific component
MPSSDVALRPRSVAADLIRPDGDAARLVWNLGLVLAGSLLVAASARIAMPLPFTPVPVSMQTFAVLLVGALLGPTRGVAAIVAYLLEGAAGLPVFVGGGGVHLLFGPTGGYLLAFVPAAGLVGFLARRGWDRSFVATSVAMAIGTAIILLAGTAWLAVMLGSVPAAVTGGLLPFLPGAAFKIALAAAVLPAAWRWLGRFEPRRDDTTN